MSSLSPDQKLLTLTQYKELASSVGVARYGSKQDLVARINGAAGGNTKLMTLIDKAKKSMVLKKGKKEKQKNNNGKASAAPDAGVCDNQDDVAKGKAAPCLPPWVPAVNPPERGPHRRAATKMHGKRTDKPI